MLRKILLGIALAGVLNTQLSMAQVFEINPNPVSVFTTGTQEMDTSMEDPFVDYELLIAHVKNLTSDPLTLQWQLLTDSTAHPEGWVVIGICDNIVCRAPYSDFYYGETQTTNPIEPGDSSLLELRVYAPVSSPDGIGTMKVLVSSNDIGSAQSDTAVYILEKGGTRIDLIPVSDNRVNLYPNPAHTEITLYIDRNLQASRVEVYNIIGRKFHGVDLSTSSELTKLPISQLSNGIYMLRVLDETGKIITTRKFTKH